MALRVLLLVFGVFCCSTAVIIINLCKVHPLLLASYRLAIAVIILSPLFIRDLLRHRANYGWRNVRAAALPGLIMAGHFVTWIIGARKTLPTNASLLVNLLVIVMPFLLYFMVRERLTRGELLGTAVAMIGVLVMAGADLRFDPAFFEGDVLCFISMIFLTTYLALGRLNRGCPTVWLYVVPLYLVAALVCFCGSLFCVSPFAVGSTNDWLCILGLAIVPTVMGHSTLNYCMRHMRGQWVSIANLFEFIFAGALTYAVLDASKAPKWNFYVAAVFVVAGAVLVIRAEPPALKNTPPIE